MKVLLLFLKIIYGSQYEIVIEYNDGSIDCKVINRYKKANSIAQMHLKEKDVKSVDVNHYIICSNECVIKLNDSIKFYNTKSNID